MPIELNTEETADALHSIKKFAAEQLAEDLAKDHGAHFAAPLYPNFENYRQARQAELGDQLNHFA